MLNQRIYSILGVLLLAGCPVQTTQTTPLPQQACVEEATEGKDVKDHDHVHCEDLKQPQSSPSPSK